LLFKHRIRILEGSEGSCDAEDWSNDVENSTLPYIQSANIPFLNKINSTLVNFVIFFIHEKIK